MKTQEFYELNNLEQERSRQEKRYFEFLRVPTMSAGIYLLPAGGTDPQTSHKEDELYYVVRGKARIMVGTEDRIVEAGSAIFVAANVAHHFHDILEELLVLVFFAPAESA